MSYAPSGPAASASGPARSSPRVTVASAPSSEARASPSGLRPRATTRDAPRARAVCTASRPEVPVAPTTRTVAPSAPSRLSGTQLDAAGLTSAAAVASDSPSGTSTAARAEHGGPLGEHPVRGLRPRRRRRGGRRAAARRRRGRGRTAARPRSCSAGRPRWSARSRAPPRRGPRPRRGPSRHDRVGELGVARGLVDVGDDGCVHGSDDSSHALARRPVEGPALRLGPSRRPGPGQARAGAQMKVTPCASGSWPE